MFVTKIMGIQATQRHITENCRRIHDKEEAVNIALEDIKKEYRRLVDFEANSKAEFIIALIVNRD